MKQTLLPVLSVVLYFKGKGKPLAGLTESLERLYTFGGKGNNGNPNVLLDGSGGAAIVWNCIGKGSPVLRAQRLNAAGAKRWGDNGILVSTVSPYYSGYSTPALISQDGYGGFIVSWAAGKNMHKASSSYVQRISAEGDRLWGGDGVRLNR